ncbi:unnamed protein product [Brachionus calyciflorus]|uniref:Adenylyl cyclase-associated protein n=1 Tax=Brachionus calyciflorus TaxID=104777 RepID=A0A813M954_9BILA|nr:unnamed protein product [Brachionus calyciflorus]
MSRIYQQPSKQQVNNNPVAPSSPASVSIQKVNLNPTNNASTKIYVNNPSSASLDDKRIESGDSKMSVELIERMEKLVSRMENATSRLENVSTSSNLTNGAKSVSVPVQNGNHDTTEDLPSITAFDDLLNSSFNSFKELSAKVGGDVKTIIDLVEKAFKLERQFLVEAARSTQPSQDAWMKFLQQYSKNIEEVQSFREKNRTSQFFNHLSAISESIGALGWIAVTPAPSPYVKEMSDAAQFYTNRVLKDYKEKDANHVQWVKQWLQVLNDLQAYVKQHHTTGVSWNSTKKSGQFDASKVTLSSSSSPAPVPSAGGPPPPPPPVMSLDDLLADNSKASQGAKTDALFAELSKGSDITKNLKKVSDDQKTHKNPNLRAGSTVPSGTNSLTTSSSSLQSKSTSTIQKPPVFELEDKKWKVEYQTNRYDLVISETDLKQTVYIYQCKECTITVKGKINSIIIDSCTRVGLLFDDVLSTVEFINSKNVQMQVLGRVPTVTIEKTDGCQVYLSKKSLETEIVTSKSSSMNILIPNENDDEFTEHPVPEQFKTKINDSRKLTTTSTESV